MQVNTLHTTFSKAHNITIPMVESFKNLAKEQKTALTDRGVPAKLSDVQESLAVAYGFENYATYLALANKEAGRIVKKINEDEGVYMLYLADVYYQDHNAEEGEFYMDCESVRVEAQAYFDRGSIPGPKLPTPIRMANLISRHNAMDYLSDNMFAVNPDGLSNEESEQIVVTGVFCQTPCVEQYGTPYYGDYGCLTARIMENFRFKAIQHLDVDLNDTGDATAGNTIFEIFVPHAVAKKIIAAKTSHQAQEQE